ncbi:MAG: hypothetical protein IKN81_11405 [Oscillospiraceae bacterium]|nr:hypothetical protein [Oscillospiraceae bacterium]
MDKSIRRKTAKFELEPDGFSIHTFELSCQIKGKQYREIKEYLYSLPITVIKGTISGSLYLPAGCWTPTRTILGFCRPRRKPSIRLPSVWRNCSKTRRFRATSTTIVNVAVIDPQGTATRDQVARFFMNFTSL